jgi:cell division protein FtsW
MAIKQKNDLNNIIKPFFDLNFFFIIITIILFGLLILTSASIELSSQNYDGYAFHYLFYQLGFLLFSIFVCSFFLYLSSENLKKNYKVFFYFFLFLLILGAIAGKTAGGSTRWLSFYGYTIQPSEFFKLFYIVWLCAYLDYNKNNIRRIEFFIIPILWFTVGAILLLLQPDFGSTAVLFFMTVLMLFIAKAKYIHLILSGIIGSLASVLVFVLNPYMVSRLDFFEPCQNGGYQLCWSLMAIGSGSVFGKGLGASTSKLLFLPEAHNDFIFAVLAEELGILGIIFIVLIFYLFFRKCFYIGNRALRVGLPFQGYLSYAIGIFITMQAFLHISVNLGLVPTKGLALPFFSYGGSNYLASMLSITIIFRIYRDVYKKSLNSSIR